MLDRLKTWYEKQGACALDPRTPSVGQQAPDFTLPDSAGVPWQLSRMVAERSLVLIFYRGHW